MSITHRSPTCQHGCGCEIRNLVHHAEQAPPHDAELLDNGEMQVLLRAVREVAEIVGHNRERLGRGRTKVIAAHSDSEQAVRALARFESANTLPAARSAHEAVEARHHEDGAHDRRRRDAWIRMLRWPMVLALGAFDAWFFKQVFQDLTVDGESPSRAEQVVSFLPGVALAVAMLLAGHVIASPLHRLRDALRERLRDRPGMAVLTGFLLPVLYLLSVLITVGMWAVLRVGDAAKEADATIAQRYPAGSVAVLMLVLALTAMAMKVVAHNPYADSAVEARRRLRRADRRYARLARRVEVKLCAHEQVCSDLQAVCDELAAQVRLESMRVWESAILRARMLHGQAGHLPPALEPGAVTAQAAAASALLFRGVAEPGPELGPLVEARRVLAEYSPTELKERWERLVARLEERPAVRG
ncbi:hypothetical protein [Embleya sp. NPDC050493]|uniref:hypothetical protein n=1 Tax=Embleya sp. NPDC050493 TaxID=3363989 RepID=UPI0037A8C1FD